MFLLLNDKKVLGFSFTLSLESLNLCLHTCNKKRNIFVENAFSSFFIKKKKILTQSLDHLLLDGEGTFKNVNSSEIIHLFFTLRPILLSSFHIILASSSLLRFSVFVVRIIFFLPLRIHFYNLYNKYAMRICVFS